MVQGEGTVCGLGLGFGFRLGLGLGLELGVGLGIGLDGQPAEDDAVDEGRHLARLAFG